MDGPEKDYAWIAKTWQQHLPYYTQIEVAVGFGGTLRLGCNPGEALDFIAGWFGIDIFGDDLNANRKKEESNQVPEDIEGRYDNHGGFAYGGHVVDLNRNGDFVEWTYSDVSNANKKESEGTWTQTNGIVRLEYKNGTIQTMHLLANGTNVLLLTKSEFEQVKKEPSTLSKIKAMKR